MTLGKIKPSRRTADIPLKKALQRPLTSKGRKKIKKKGLMREIVPSRNPGKNSPEPLENK
jgi:hypothetical protein